MQASDAALVAACIAAETIEQVLYRLASTRKGQWLRFIAPAVVLHVVCLLLWYLLLRNVPLSVALPLMGAQYVTIAIAGKLLFRERVDLRRWIGIGIIIIGFVLVAANES